MLNLYIDFDGVIMDTMDNLYKIMEKNNIKPNNNDEETQKFFCNLNWNEILKKSEPINDSWNCIQKIIDSNKFNLAILTHVNSISEAEIKIHYIRRYYKDITIIVVPKSISKTKMIKSKGAVLIDDFLDNLIEWKEEGGHGIKFDLDMDGKGFDVIDRLDVLIDMFE